MSEKNPNNDFKMPTKREFDAEKDLIDDAAREATSRASAERTSQNIKRLGAMVPHDDPDELEKGSKKPSSKTRGDPPKLRVAEGRPNIREVAASEEVDNDEVAPPSTGTSGAGLEGTVSISSWEAHFPETDKQSETTTTVQSEQPDPFSQPGAHRVPGINGGGPDDETSVGVISSDNTVPPRTANHESDMTLVHAEAVEQTEVADVKPAEVFEAHEVGYCGLGTKSRALIVVGIVLLVIACLMVGLVLGLGRSGSSTVQERLVTSSPTLAPSSAPTWTQIGEDLFGEASRDLFGESIALSGDGGILAVGAPWNDGNGDGSGSVRVYQQNVVNGTRTWTRLGSDIDGSNAGDTFGSSVSLSNDGTVLAVGAIGNDSNGDASGQVRVFRFVNNEWTPIGDPINGRGEGDWFGRSVALSADGTIVAGGAPVGNYTLVYQFQNGNWNQLGSDISGDAYSVSLSHDGTVLAAYGFETRVYRFVSNRWTQIGNLIGNGIDGIITYGQSSVSLSADGRIVAVGAPDNDDDNGDSSGAAYVYQNVNDEWIQVGSDLYGLNEGDRFGGSVSLSDDGTVLAVGAIGNDSNGDASGQVRVFRFVNNEWIPIGDPINGRGWRDFFGISVALSADGTIVAGGAPQRYKDGTPPGYALVHRLEEQ